MLSTPTHSGLLSKAAITPEQDKAIDALYEGNILLIAEAGFGKAMVGQTACQELLADGHLKRILVVAPLGVCDLTWATEWQKWEHLRQPAIATGSAFRRSALIESDAPIVVLNIENLAWFLKTYPEHNFDGLLVDEVSKFKAVTGATMKLLRWRLKEFNWRCAMTATPVNESGTDIYTQVMIVDGGETLGRSQDRFRRNYFMQMDFKGYKWDFQHGGDVRLAEALKDVIFVADGQDYTASLPKVKEVIIEVEMSEYTQAVYAEMANEMYIEIDDQESEAVNLAVMQGKLQQISNGFVYDSAGNPIVVDTDKDYYVEQWLAKKESLIIVYQWDFEKDYLRELGVPIFADDKAGIKAKWDTGKLHAIALHPKSASHGLNLQDGGHTMLIMSPFWSSDNWEQIFSRIWRRGQRAKVCTRVVLVTKNSVEQLACNRLTGKKEKAGAFVKHLKHYSNLNK